MSDPVAGRGRRPAGVNRKSSDRKSSDRKSSGRTGSAGASTGRSGGGAPSAGLSLAGHAARALTDIIADWPAFEIRALAGAAPGLPALPGAPSRDPVPADRRLADYFRQHPALGQRDRRWVADRVFDVLRNARSHAAWLLAESGPGSGTTASLAERLVTLSGRLSDDVPDPAYAAFAAGLPPAIRHSLPDWLWEQLERAWPARADAVAAALTRPAPVDLRCNLLRTKPAALIARLAADGIVAEPVLWPDADGPRAEMSGSGLSESGGSPWSRLASAALRVDGRPALERSQAFADGEFEPQDAGSQRIADACDVRRGEVVVDFCAGAGGKTLALAARMRDVGRLFAFDTDAPRLARLAPRAARAGVSIITAMRIDGATDPRLGRYQGKADCVLVDAPCGGSGTLRRSPDLKWRYGPGDIARFLERQQEVLMAAARLVRPGGRLVYATCSLLTAENTGSAAAFADRWRQQGDGRGLEALGVASMLPDSGSDGFFVAKWIVGSRRAGPGGTIQ